MGALSGEVGQYERERGRKKERHNRKHPMLCSHIEHKERREQKANLSRSLYGTLSFFPSFSDEVNELD
jgi:hypothetical protein